MTRRIYLDNNATTPLDSRVRDAMLPWLGRAGVNPSSGHREGRAARLAVEEARADVAMLLGVPAEEILFTASGTEANNAVVRDAVTASGGVGRLVLSAFEHPSIAAEAELARRAGLEIVEIRPEPDGMIRPDVVTAALTGDTRLVCLMLANNEIGTVQPVAAVAEQARLQGIPVLCDAVQAVGKIPVSAGELGVDFLTLGGHKFHGPLGAGALWIRAGLKLRPLLVGGGQETGRRASTENVPAIVGLGAAARLARAELPEREAALAQLRDVFEEEIRSWPGVTVHGAGALRLPNTSHVSFAGIEGEALRDRLDRRGVAISTGSACSTGSPTPSRAMRAIGVGPDEAFASIRVSFGLENTAEELELALALLAEETERLRQALA